MIGINDSKYRVVYMAHRCAAVDAKKIEFYCSPSGDPAYHPGPVLPGVAMMRKDQAIIIEIDHHRLFVDAQPANS
jgi:hypothetical protein